MHLAHGAAAVRSVVAPDMKSVDCENRNIYYAPKIQVVSSLSAIPHTDQGHEKIANYQYFLQYQRKKMLVDYSGTKIAWCHILTM
ncbi:hypothetical protein BS78_K121900 [Paspalum vaginatum]|uniref:Uncharacterized protein n=1 Tax=Paspalum vaginatum TaxID=158149 RepID=A0A9W7X6H1_9POAL|nr:hypothetical protein BS78_K121900 [Paspalum vaginatum]